MKPGQGKAKGSEFEREIGRELSIWVSGEEKRNDLFRRTVLSGGQYTAVSKGEPGDLGANHPLAFPFLENIVVECKHWKYLELMDFVMGSKGSSELYKAVIKTQEQAKKLRKFWLFIAKQNFRPTILICPSIPILDTIQNGHHFFQCSMFLGRLDDVLNLNYDDFLLDCKVSLMMVNYSK